MSENRPLPIACNMSVFNPKAMVRYAAVAQRLKASGLHNQELPDGWRLSFVLVSTTLVTLAEFIALERLCCPFIEFTLRLDPAARPYTST